MITVDEARAIAVKTLSPGMTLGEPIEHEQGWRFTYVIGLIGSNGVVVHKQTGKPYVLGSAYPLEREPFAICARRVSASASFLSSS